jgi:hypothetical protein
MTNRAIIFSFITLTLLDGTRIKIEALPGVVSVITPAHSPCAHRGTAITVGAKGLCVREAPDEIEKLLEKAREQ